ncbi:MAG: L,D-transpeptidase family protein [Roseibacillus sp.]
MTSLSLPKLLSLALSLLVLSCASVPLNPDEESGEDSIASKPIYLEESDTTFWNNEPGDGPFRVEIDLSEQLASFYRGSVQVGQTQVATGKSGHATPTGSFRITEKIVDKRSNLYGQIFGSNGELVNSGADKRKDSVPSGGKFVGAPMPYWMRLTSYGIGMHVGAIPYPGSPASHGCIRMPEATARLAFASSRVGTPVKVVP